MPSQPDVTVGIDLGDRHSHLCLIDTESGEIIEESRIPTTQKGLERRFSGRGPMRIAIEAGTHSPWVSRTSIKRYAVARRGGRTLAPRKHPGSKPKLDERARALLESDVEERPAATLKDRRRLLEAMAGVSVSKSTLSRLLRKMGFSPKDGAWERQNATSS